MELRFDGRVAVVTGAGGGLGREYALLLASRGAAVVVNDLGGSRSGEGKSSSAADRVVDEIRNSGGTAVADYNSVTDGEKIVQTAIDNFGRIDIVINNAGILRDKSFLKITEEEWDSVYQVHLKGSFLVTKAAWPHFRKQNYGRVIMTASPAGIYGNFGQANYSSAKLGALALSNTLAIEGSKYQILCNTIVPVAASRLTQDILPPNLYEPLNPAFVAPVVVWLCHESNTETGGVFEAAGGFVGKYRWQRSNGKVFLPPQSLTPEKVRDSWDSITDMEASSYPASIHDHMTNLVSALTGSDIQSSEQNKKQVNDAYQYSADDLILYALGVGVSTKDSDHLKFLYECDENFAPLPTFGVIPSMKSLFDHSVIQDALTALNLKCDPTKLLHGEQYLEMINPIPNSGSLTSEPRVLEVLDKGSGALLICEVDTFDENGRPILYNQFSLFMIGSGNFGGKRKSENFKVKPMVERPNRSPDFTLEEQTSVNQAALYRLCGDKNPLHIDPMFAAVGGFSRPIMHGLCTMGFATRHVLKKYANNDVTRFKAIKARFAGPITPGQTIQTNMWKEANRIHFESLVKETGKPIITGAYIDLHQNGSGSDSGGEITRYNHKLNEEISTKLHMNALESLSEFSSLFPRISEVCENSEALGNFESWKMAPLDKDSEPFMLAQGSGDDGKGPVDGKCKIDLIFENWLANRILENNYLVELIKTVYQWNITKNGKIISVWTMDLKNGNGGVFKGLPKVGKADCILTIDDDFAVDIFEGRKDAMRAFMTGKLKIAGNILAAQKLQQLWVEAAPKGSAPVEDSIIPELTKQANQAQVIANSDVPFLTDLTDDKALLESIPTTGLKSDIVFNAFKIRMHEEPEMIKRLRVTFQFNITKDGNQMAVWTADNKATLEGEVYREPPKNGKPDCTVTVEDDDFVKLMVGKLNPQRAFMMGKLKIKGNILLLQKLNSLWLELQKSGKTPELPFLTELLTENVIPGLRSEPMTIELIQRLVRLPQLNKEIGGSVMFDITKNGQSATKYNFTAHPTCGLFNRGPPKSGEAKATFTIEDDDFVRLTYNRMKLEEGIANGKIKFEGDKSIPPKLSILFTTPTSRKAKL